VSWEIINAGNWTRWYRDAIKLAEDRYARYPRYTA